MHYQCRQVIEQVRIVYYDQDPSRIGACGERTDHPTRQCQWRTAQLVRPRRECTKWHRSSGRCGGDMPHRPALGRDSDGSVAGQARLADPGMARQSDTPVLLAAKQFRDDVRLDVAACQGQCSCTQRTLAGTQRLRPVFRQFALVHLCPLRLDGAVQAKQMRRTIVVGMNCVVMLEARREIE